jgi:integrase
MGGKDRPNGKAPKQRRRRAAGEGTVYQDKQGQWWAAIGSGRNRKTVRCPQRQNTEAEARRILKRLQEELEAGVNLKVGKIAFTQFAQQWLNEILDPGLKPKTMRFYRQLLENQILPELGDNRLDQLQYQPELIQRWLNRLRGQVGDQTAAHAFAVGKRVLKAAVRWRYIRINPFDAVDAPRVKREKRTPLSPAQMQALRTQVMHHRLALLYDMTMLYGLREGEALGLRWSDIDWATATIAITQQVQTVDGRTGFETPKTQASLRRLALTPGIVARLRQQWERIEQEWPAAKRWVEHDLIFPSTCGTPIQPRNLVRHYKLALASASIPTTFTVHDLRHTAASRLADVGAPQVVVAIVLGHELPGVTGDYTHANIETARPWLEKVEQQFFAALE